MGLSPQLSIRPALSAGLKAISIVGSSCLFAAVLALPTGALAADASLVKGKAKAGESKAVTCVACHGIAGNSTNPEWPKLAGQGAPFVYAQLKAFKSGERNNALMSAQAANLSDQDMRDLAAYYASVPATPGVASEASIEVAQPLYRAGNAERNIPACLACHGPAGAGNDAAAYPAISGQHSVYLSAALKTYRSGERGKGVSGQMMQAVAKNLTDAEIEALASYVAGLQ